MQSLGTAFSKPSDASFPQPLQGSLSRSAKTPLAKSSSKRSLREVEEDDEEGALSGQEMSPGKRVFAREKSVTMTNVLFRY